MALRTQIIVLENIAWATYQALLHDTQEQHVRMTYDGGTLTLEAVRLCRYERIAGE